MSATPGRNQPCPCGSGKKFKRCCASNPTILHGVCASCGKLAASGLECRLCDKRYGWCREHETVIRTSMNGHVLRSHPESLPRSAIDKLLDSSEALAAIQTEAKKDPPLWAKLLQHLEERRQQRQSAPKGAQN